MPHFLLRLVPIRPTFPYDMSDSEKETMGRHADYCQSLIDKGIAVAFGPVFDPKGAWGLGILEVAHEAEAQSLMAQDPAALAGLGHYEVAPMRLSMLRRS
jgi:uncharacterized protein YciI